MKIKQISDRQNLVLSCLHLGFYLASWGMYRGSATLLKEKDVTVFIPLLEHIAKSNIKLWEIDVDKYSGPNNIEIIIEERNKIRNILGTNSDVLVTKIMLGVFGNVPAFDRFFCLGIFGSDSRKLTKKNLKIILSFYKKKKDTIDSYKIKTINIQSRRKFFYPKAKIVDMYGFMKGLEEDKKRKNEKRKSKKP